MPTEGERIAVVEQILRDMRGDMQGFADEQGRTRERLHKAEGTLRGLVLVNQQEAKAVRGRQDKMLIRLRVLTVVIAAAALAEPFLYKAAGL